MGAVAVGAVGMGAVAVGGAVAMAVMVRMEGVTGAPEVGATSMAPPHRTAMLAPARPSVREAPGAVGGRVCDVDHVVLDVQPLLLARGAEIVVVADEALEAVALDRPVAAIADDAGMKRAPLSRRLLTTRLSSLPLPLPLLRPAPVLIVALAVTLQNHRRLTGRTSKANTAIAGPFSFCKRKK